MPDEDAAAWAARLIVWAGQAALALLNGKAFGGGEIPEICHGLGLWKLHDVLLDLASVEITFEIHLT